MQRLLAGLAIGLFALLYSAASSAQAQRQAPAVLDFNLPAQPLDAALRQLANQHRLQVVFSTNDVRGLTAPAIKGRHTVDAVLQKLTEGTPLTYSFNGQDVVVVRSKAEGQAQNPTQLAQAQTPGAGASEDRENRLPEPRPPMVKIEVAGSRIKRLDIDTYQPVKLFERDEIERSGQATVVEFLNTVPEVSINAIPQGQGAQTVQLRGLPRGATLVLVNGRRPNTTAVTFGDFFNINFLPLSIVERIEVIPSGSSAIYGSSAIAGVINIVLKKRIDGWEGVVGGGQAEGINDGRASLAFGGEHFRTKWLATLAYQERGILYGSEREITADADYRRFGGADLRTTRCIPGNVFSATTANLPGLGATSAAIPDNPSGRRLTASDFIAGGSNLCSSFEFLELIRPMRNKTALFRASHDLSRDLELYADLLYNQNGPVSFRTLTATTSPNRVLVPATNAFNPFGTAVRVDLRLRSEDAHTTFEQEQSYARAVLGVAGNLWPNWTFDIAAEYMRDYSPQFTTDSLANSAALTAALASANPSTALNPFTTGPSAAREVLDAIFTDIGSWARGSQTRLSGFARGPLFGYGPGDVEGVIGAEVGRETLTNVTGANQVRRDYRRNAWATFGEVKVPLWSSRDSIGSREILAATIAGRYDRDDANTGDKTAQLGLEWRPLRSVLVRGAYAEAFKSPTLIQENPTPSVLSLTTARDPFRGNELVNAQAFFGPRPLDPESGQSGSIGIAWEPEWLERSRLVVSAWKVTQEKRVAVPAFQTIINNPDFYPGAVVREPSSGGQPGRITALNWGNYNFGDFRTRGIDLEVSKALPAFRGELRGTVAATRVLEFESALVPGAPIDNGLGVLNRDAWAPKWKVNAAVSWSRAGWSAQLVGRHISKYIDGPGSTRTLGGKWIFDVSARIPFDRLAGGAVVKRAHLSFGVVNLADTLPEFSTLTERFDATQADVRGRYVYASATVAW